MALYFAPTENFSYDEELLERFRELPSYKAIPPTSFGVVRLEGVFTQQTDDFQCIIAYVKVDAVKSIVMAYIDKRIAVLVEGSRKNFYNIGESVRFNEQDVDETLRDVNELIRKLCVVRRR